MRSSIPGARSGQEWARGQRIGGQSYREFGPSCPASGNGSLRIQAASKESEQLELCDLRAVKDDLGGRYSQVKGQDSPAKIPTFTNASSCLAASSAISLPPWAWKPPVFRSASSHSSDCDFTSILTISLVFTRVWRPCFCHAAIPGFSPVNPQGCRTPTNPCRDILLQRPVPTLSFSGLSCTL